MNIQPFDFSVDILKVVKWEYDQAPNLKFLLNIKQEWYTRHHARFWDEWERDVFNLFTANDFGLNVWAIILDLPLYTQSAASSASYPAFGFSGFGLNFGRSNFATDADTVNRLTVEQKRQLLRMRWWQIISDGSMPSLNHALYDVFGSEVYALDGHDMAITVVYQKVLPNLMMRLLQDFDLIPRPAGVKLNHLVKPGEAFGFAPHNLNFDQPHSQFRS
ncbi:MULTISPECIES: DUF2612 domain-containing protein [Franconibacter]|uniref:DUF2612 domain-containing protein n=1 Tax=Franconibacter TaxID=1649295 RepID=UPI001FF81524|nr:MULTISPECIES: DUF2612 domain-containing protein [Franconibacter]MCK1967166.1 DUF2612 domain-containing protein [Franconibacter sp. IITDAS19]MEB5921428.1 DUF2612 domain-containing protein [Franconibacter daqui]